MKLIQLQRLAQKLRQKVSQWRGTSGQIYFVHRVDQYRRIWERIAVDIEAELVELAPDLWELRKGGQRTRINNYLLQLDDPVTLNLAGRKALIHELLRQDALPIPEYAVFGIDALDDARHFFAQHRLGCVIKPSDGYGGKGVTTHITDVAHVKDAAVLASLYSHELLIEAQIAGECFRVLVFDGEVLSVVRRSGLRVTGDGRSSLRTLIARAGRSVDGDCRFTLAAQQLELEFVPAPTTTWLVQGNRSGDRASELRTVYDSDVTSEAHPLVVDAAVRATRLVGSRFLGVDIISPDITRPLEEVGGCINEVNTTPALHHHYDSAKEPYPVVARTIVERLLTPPRELRR